MKQLFIIAIYIFSCQKMVKVKHETDIMFYKETEILKELDLAFHEIPSSYFPEGKSQDIKYNFFLDLENGYVKTGGSKIHLYADATRWAIVFEKNGYHNRATCAEIELTYIGNCVDYHIETFPERSYISNQSNIILIEPTEFERIENKEDKGLETFELIAPNTKEVKIRDTVTSFENNYTKYENIGIAIQDYKNPNKLISFENLVRYLQETNPTIISANETDIKEYLPNDLPKLMTIDAFHYVSFYNNTPPSKQETFKLIAKILTTKDVANWKPTQQPNNHWKNWKSGDL
ncbi:MAG: hypothetical protein K1X55_11880 [Chitinophagales bacterium]|nr:hypothetical protein [Chitinophagales bacterium]